MQQISNVIEDYSFGRIELRGKTYTSDVIIYPDHIDGGWWRKQGHLLCLDDLEDIIAARPHVLVIGTGAQGMMRVADEVPKQMSELGIELKVARTGKACKLYNRLAQQQKSAVAALHLTC